MADRRPAGVIIESFHDDRVKRTVTLLLSYEGKEAQIVIPVAEPRFDREPGVETYRRELQQILAALQEAIASPEGIRWPYHPQREQP
jgi:hypothetical protein